MQSLSGGRAQLSAHMHRLLWRGHVSSCLWHLQHRAGHRTSNEFASTHFSIQLHACRTVSKRAG